MSFFSKLMRAGEGKTLKQFEEVVGLVNAAEPEVERLTDAQLAERAADFRRRSDAGEPLDSLIVETFATVREGARRVLGQRHFDVQVIGALALNRGMVAEMKTGEGKTLVSTMPAYLNAVAGKGVHIVTVNDYLASRDADWMGSIHRFLGLSIGLIQTGMSPAERHPAYRSDITYGTNNEFGFDYLRDNMAMRASDRVQRGHPFAIVDEVDSILIDEARTPLIISGRLSDSARWYRDFARIVERLRKGEHYEVDEAKRQVLTTEEGVTRVEQILSVENLYDHAAVDFVHHLESALRAKELYHKDVEYLLDGGEVKIVDEFTGRVLEGRRYSEGLHQAIEAKEGVKIKDENQTLATITLQNYFRLYEKLAGMTGTAETEAAELAQIYGLEVLVIPTNRDAVRIDQADVVYKTEEAKFDSVVEDVVARHHNGQPVLLGTVSIEKSERLSRLFLKRGIPHEVLNAKHHAREAEIIAQAGRPGAVTVATNMAGRGVDIMLGGNPEGLARVELKKQGVGPDHPEFEKRLQEMSKRFEADITPAKGQVIESGGLYVIGTERHESRRIDNQLRGRSGRQGDPGESRFYLSMGDDLMRRFSGDRITGLMDRMKIPDDVPIEAGMVTKAIERAQRTVEAQNFEIRKNVLKYDEVMNRQREVIYQWREDLIDNEDSKMVRDWIDGVVAETVEEFFSAEISPADWDWELLNKELSVYYPSQLERDQFDRPDLEDISTVAGQQAHDAYHKREVEFGEPTMRQVERQIILSVIDNKWREHLSEMDYLRAGIGLRAMGQRDPLVEYQREAYLLFSDLVDSVKRDTVRYLFHVQIVQPGPVKAAPQPLGPEAKLAPNGTGRNDPCPCGSGKKYKRCHGAS